ncbi:Putative UPF0053 inner membrane protein YgdQ [Candidatus Erwinia haradaeae]|uniref:UPF0053 inner membrane protein YgdQ n=1 Tax=Candidatus Erwinia haradaeae TaxID=1922217 RepID=A0A451DC68_9GAMM|nr:TerC family protein [Candidatus Erwinia haradaeae]VFP84011.1 Putative UPF0053 inner membrane protein YgdQ [Candidatus Erwinia haradaeae]
MYEWITNPDTWLALGTLTILEVILGIDNIIFLMLIVEKLPKKKQHSAHFLGMSAAMVMRLILLTFITQIMHYTDPLFAITDHNFSVRDLILLLGGVFLFFSSSLELYNSVQGVSFSTNTHTYPFLGAMIQIILLDIIFSLDSIITAVGLSDHLLIMMTAVVIAVLVMMLFSSMISDYISKHPSIKILALSSLVLISMTLILESVGIHITKSYIYFAMFFSGLIESLEIIRNKNALLNSKN